MNLPRVVRSKLEAFVCQPIDMMTVPRRNLDIDCFGVSAYFRVAYRSIRGFICPTLDLARISIAPNCRKQGYLREILTILESNPQGLPVYVESMLNLDLIPMYERRGYVVCVDDGYGVVDLFYQPKQPPPRREK